MSEKPIVIDCGGNGRVAVRWNNTAGIDERPRLVAVEWRDKEKADRRRPPVKIEPPKKIVRRGAVQGSLL